jgi:hypothetical protein
MIPDSRNWLLKFAATFALLLACCWATPRLFANVPQFQPITTGQYQEQIFDRYFKLPRTEVVITGSSLAYHLREQYFEGGNVRNASLPGGSPLTALAIIDADPSARPRVIAVESNILDRAIQKDLVDKFKDARRPEPPLPAMRTLAAWYEGSRAGEFPFTRDRIRSILAIPPSPDRSNTLVATIEDDWNKELPREALLQHARELKAMAEKFEAQGVKVFFFEMPYPSRLNNSRFAVVSREVFAEVVPPGDKRRLTLDYPMSDMRSEADGVHLDDRSSLEFAQALDQAIKAKLAEPAR